MVKTLITQALLVLLSLNPAEVGTTTQTTSSYKEELTLVVPDRKITVAKKRNSFRAAKEFLQFELLGKVNTNNVNTTFINALTSYKGPKVKITSLVRHWNNKSQHGHGKAVDMEFSHDLINWLISEEGQQWLGANNLMFYIEAKPGSPALKQYKSSEPYSKYVFENPSATGPHVHIQIKK